MKILIFGAQGIAGHMISRYLSKNTEHKVYGVSRYHGVDNLYLDVESESCRRSFFNSPLTKDFDFVINCIGVLGPDSTKNLERTVLLNSWWPHYLEEQYKHNNTKVIHISTDCIFDGKRGWYIESDLPTETNIYGRSKAMGELNNDKDITLRMSIIGTEIKKENRSGLINFVLSNTEDKIFGWEKAIWNGITTYELAKQIANYINNPIISGIYHLVPDHNITKYHLVSHINDIFECDKEIVPIAGKEENKSLIDTRNEHKVFTPIPGYRDQLLELKEFST
jgi:dTDP-4-dehydrorhamnose reductase